MLEALILCAAGAAYAMVCLVGMTLWEQHKRIRRRWRIHAERRAKELAENEAAFQARLARRTWELEAQNRELEAAKVNQTIIVKGVGAVKLSELMMGTEKETEVG